MEQMPDGWMPSGAGKEFIRSCVKALADVCDGAKTEDGNGYNGADAKFGHQLAGLPLRWWTLPRYWAAVKMLRKYHGQLERLGFDVAASMPTGAVQKPAAVRVAVESDYGSMSTAEFLDLYGVLPVPPAAPADTYIVDEGPFTAEQQARIEEMHEAINRSNAPSDVVIISLPPTKPSAAEIAARYPSTVEDAPPYSSRQILGPNGVIAAKLPGYEQRFEQLELAELFEHAMLEEVNAVTEAGTGTGKSLAYLVPAINMSYRRPHPATNRQGDQIERGYSTIVSTADKSLQAQLWGKDIPFLQSVMPRPFRAALLKGRSNYLCLYNVGKIEQDGGAEQMALDMEGPEEKANSFAPDLALLPEVLTWGKTTGTGDLEELPFMVTGRLRQVVAMDSEGCLGGKCPSYKVCWAEKAKKLAADADVVIVNHALLLRDISLRAGSDGSIAILPDADYIVIDEAHHLEDIATESFGKEATERQWDRIASQWLALTIKHPEVAGRLEEMSEETVAAVRYGKLVELTGGFVTEVFAQLTERLQRANKTQDVLGHEAPLLPPFENLRDEAIHMGSATPYWLKDPTDRERWIKLADRIEQWTGAVLSALRPDESGEWVRYMELSGSARYPYVTLYAKPIDVSEILRAALFSSSTTKAVIATSATIATEGAAPFGYWTSRVGADNCETLQVGSPFDYGRHALLYLPTDGKSFDPTQSRQDGSVEYLDRLAAEYERLILASSGRAFALFTSFRTLNEVHSRLSHRLSRSYLVLKQGELPRPELVKRFKQDGNAVLFGVKSFWEGVDIQGEALSLVIIDKLPFTPPDDPVWRARCDAVTRKTGDRMAWFQVLALPQVIIALKQGFGRLIRTKEDRGVVAILDGRLSVKPYGSRILRALPPATQTRAQAAVQAFFGS